jgi:hypothetical protein
MQHGQLLLSLYQAPSSLERLLAVAKLSVTFLADLLRRSDDTQDIPLLILGHHYISHRVLGAADTDRDSAFELPARVLLTDSCREKAAVG